MDFKRRPPDTRLSFQPHPFGALDLSANLSAAVATCNSVLCMMSPLHHITMLIPVTFEMHPFAKFVACGRRFTAEGCACT
jgi:hypothetical protein